ncbi:F-box domain-containing protein [Mycena kentingensis (nom. inval.)]|nr:F-box domain-containing protein [Mycena kentingensis (nom. inval.)]
MADTFLPDEILSEILSPALKVADNVFSDTSTGAFATYQESTSAYLLVNKAWLRVSTPLLYHTVVLRSKAQAVALADALTKNTDFGRFVRRLRVEGGFGPSMKKILTLTPNVVDLFLSLNIYSSDNTAGLCSGLELINPTSLILASSSQTSNKMRAALIDALAAAIRGWHRLTTFDAPFHYNMYIDSGASSIFQAFSHANRLQNLVVPSATVDRWVYPLVQRCPLRTIESKLKKSDYNTFIERPNREPKIVYKYRSDPATPQTAAPSAHILPPPLNPFFRPLEHAPADVRAAIWTRIIYFAMDTPKRACNSRVGASADTGARSIHQARLPLLLVSKEFLDLGFPIFYSHIALTWLNSARFRAVQPRCIAVESITGRGNMMTEFFVEITRYHGSTLIDYDVPVLHHGSRLDGASFAELTALKRLAWDSALGVSTRRNTPSAAPALEELTVRAADKSFLALFARSKLPHLQVLQLLGDKNTRRVERTAECVQLVEAHAPKLRTLYISTTIAAALGTRLLTLGNRVGSLTIALARQDTPPSVASLSPPQRSTALTKLIFTVPSKKLGKPKDIATAWTAFFTQWDYETSAPNLAEIQFASFSWPTTERDIAKNPWVALAETLLEEDVHLLDRDGKGWRPRLQVTKGRRR